VTRLPPRPAPEKMAVSGVTLSLISLSLSELRKDVAQLLDADWPEPARRRAHELASALWEACSRQGLHEMAGLARALASLAGLSHEKAAPLRPALREKFDELLRSASRLLDRLSKRHTG
jgi:hypothetical protein